MKPSVTRPHSLAYIEIVAEDLDAWTGFSEEVLGVGTARSGDELLLRTDDAPFRVAVRAGGSTALSAVGWLFAGEQAWTAARRSLEQFGVDLSAGSAERCAQRGVTDLASFVDPGGLVHELVWGRLMTVAQPFHPPHGISRFVDGIGHVVVMSEKALETRELLEANLGLELTDYRAGAWFLRCNHRHHSLALVQSDANRMHHFMLEVGELDDVGRALDRAERHRVVARELGRHSNDHMFSFYAQAPGGVEVEYGWGGRSVGESWVAHQIDGGDLWGHQPRRSSRSANADRSS
jgi:2,3-dihydroxybiphenyl 1,2-dioxygenase